MVTTLSPCDMRTGAILLYKIPRVIIGENRTFLGGEELLRSRGVEVVAGRRRVHRADGDFIAREPALWNEDIGEGDPRQRRALSAVDELDRRGVDVLGVGGACALAALDDASLLAAVLLTKSLISSSAFIE